MRARKIGGAYQYDTYVEIDGEELEVTVEYEVSPAEPDVNFAGSLDLCAVLHGKEDLIDKISSEETDRLVERVSEWHGDYHNPYNDPRY